MKFFGFPYAANALNHLPKSQGCAILENFLNSEFFKLINILRSVILPAIFIQELFNKRVVLTLHHLRKQHQNHQSSKVDNDDIERLEESEQKSNQKTVLTYSFNALIAFHKSNPSALISILKLRNCHCLNNLSGKYEIIAAYALFKRHKFSELLSLIPMSQSLQPFTALLLSKACISTQCTDGAQKLCTLTLKPILQREQSSLRNCNAFDPLSMKKIRTTYEGLLKCMSVFFKKHKFGLIQNMLFPLLKEFFINISSFTNGLLQLIKGWSKNHKRRQSSDCYQLAQWYISKVRENNGISLFYKKASCLRIFIECQLSLQTYHEKSKLSLQNTINQLFNGHYNDLDISCYGTAIRICTQSHNEKISIDLFKELVSRVQTAQLQSSNPLFDKSQNIIENSMQSQRNMPMVQIAINQLLDVLAKRGKVNKALQIFNGISQVLCKTQIYPSSTVPFNQILQALMRSGQTRRGWEFFEQKIFDSGVKIDNFTLSALAKGITKECHAQDLDRLLKLIDHEFKKKQNDKQQNKIEIIVFNVIMLGCINVNQAERALSIFKLLDFQSDYDIDKIRSMSSFKDPQKLIFNRIYTPIYNTQPDIVSYNTLIKAALKSHKFNSAYSFYQILKFNQRIKANDVTYNTLIDGCTKTPHQMYLGWQLLQEMCQNNIQPDSFTYSSLVKGIKKYGNGSRNSNKNGLQSALKFLNSLLCQGIDNQAADQVLFNSVMDTCIHFKKFDKALELFNQMKNRRIEPSSITYGILIKGFGQNRQINKAIQIYEQMSQKRLQPNQVTYGCLIDACVNNNKMNKAIELFNSLRQASSNSPVKGANTIIYTTLIKGYTRRRDLASALQLYHQMKEQDNLNCQPNNVTFNSLIDCCVRVGDLKIAGQIWNELQNHPKLSPDLISFSTMIKGYCQSGMIADAFEMLDTMIAKYNITPDQVLFNSLLDGCFRSDAYDIGNMVFERMRSANLLMTEISYSIMIKMYGKQAKIQKAFGLLQELKSKKMNAGVILYTCLIKACFQQEEDQRAIQAFQMLKQEGIIPDQVVYQTMIQGLMFAGKKKENQICLQQAAQYAVEGYNSYGVCIVRDLKNQLIEIIAIAQRQWYNNWKLNGLIDKIKKIGTKNENNKASSNYQDNSLYYDRQSINHIPHNYKNYESYNKNKNWKKSSRVNSQFVNNQSNSFQQKRFWKPKFVRKQPSQNTTFSKGESSQDQEIKTGIKEPKQQDDLGYSSQAIINAPLQRQDYQNVLVEKGNNCMQSSKANQNGKFVKRSGYGIEIGQKENPVDYEQENVNYLYNQQTSSYPGKFKYYNTSENNDKYKCSKIKSTKFNQHNLMRF